MTTLKLRAIGVRIYKQMKRAKRYKTMENETEVGENEKFKSL